MNARETALRVLQEVDTGNRKSEEALNRILEEAKTGQPDRSLARELVSGTLKYRLQCDFVIGRYYRHDYSKAAPVLKNILRLGAYQLIHLDRVPRSAAVNECVKLARKYKGEHLSRLVNGVLRKISAETADLDRWTEGMDAVGRLSVIYSYPVWIVERWLARYGFEKAESMLAHGNRPPLTACRVNRLKTTPEALASKPGLETIEPLGDGLGDFFFSRDFRLIEPLLQEGLVSVQNPAQALACLLAAPAGDSTVYDMCAAPGGKSTCMAELMGNTGRIIALDRSAHRLERVARNAAALGISIIETHEGDALAFDPGCRPDTILLDAPCTGTGVLGRRAELRWRTGPEKLEELVRLQAAMLERAAEVLRPGGTLVYATCSVEPEENEQQAEAFLSRHPSFERAGYPDRFPEAFRKEGAATGSVLTLPGEREGFDGGFAARFRKKEA